MKTQLLPKDKRQWRFMLMRLTLLAAVVGALMGWMIWMPGKSHRGELPPLTIGERSLAEGLERHVRVLADEIGERHVYRPQSLAQAEDFIEGELAVHGYPVRRQEFTVADVSVCNIEMTIPPSSASDRIIVLGAHYDSVPDCPAANDNGSGIAALLELARRFAAEPPSITLRFVAFVNEEPPFFHSDTMGSRVYARACRERGDRIVGMISLETIGYYDDSPGSQKYPPPFSLLYPDTGNFIAFVGNTRSAGWVRKVVREFRGTTRFPSEGAALPGGIPGVGWSDHWSFWQESYPALMVTDTAPFRYPFYHHLADTPDKLDYERMARVVAGLERAIRSLATR